MEIFISRGFLKSVLLLRAIADSYEIIKALNKNVWESSVVTHTHICSRDGYLPYICEFSNVFVDLARVYLIPKSKSKVTCMNAVRRIPRF